MKHTHALLVALSLLPFLSVSCCRTNHLEPAAQQVRDRALDWVVKDLRAHPQSLDGIGISITGLALLSTGSTTLEGPYKEDLRHLVEDAFRTLDSARFVRDYIWQKAFLGWFLAEVYARDPSVRIKGKVQEIAREFEACQLTCGGWGHTSWTEEEYRRYRMAISGDLGYTYDLMVMTNCAYVALGRMRQAGIPVPERMVSRALPYYTQGQNPGGWMIYATEQHDTAAGKPTLTTVVTDESHAVPRTWMGALALDRLGLAETPVYRKAVDYIRKSGLDPVPEGHAGPFPAIVFTGFTAHMLGEDLWKAYVAKYLTWIEQRPDGKVGYRGVPENFHHYQAILSAITVLTLDVPAGRVLPEGLSPKAPVVEPGNPVGKDVWARALDLQALTAPDAKGKVEDILPLLKDPSPRIRGWALQALAALGAKEHTREIAALVKDEDDWVRGWALWTLGELKADAEVAGALKNPDVYMRTFAGLILARAGVKSRTAEVAALLSDESSVCRGYGIEALGILDAREYAPQIRALLNDKGDIRAAYRVCQAAEMVLKGWGMDAAPPSPTVQPK